MSTQRAHLHERLAAGRTALEEITRSRPEPSLVDLLAKLDDALRALHDESWGLCRVCNETISANDMVDHPLVSVCLECMNRQQRASLEDDLKAAAEVQRTLLPPVPLVHDGWQIDYLWEPFSLVSGDHVDVIRPRDVTHPLHLLLGDVAGKGFGASLLQSQLHALFRALVPMGFSLPDLLARANQLFFEGTSPSGFATLTATRLHADGSVTLANAGHPRPLLSDRRGVRPIEDASIPLGMVGEADYVEREVQMRPGDTLMFYTDGLTEAWRNGVEYGVGRAAAALRRARDLPLREMLTACREDLADFVGGPQRGDDLTMVAVRRAD